MPHGTRSARDVRRRTDGQNFLVDRHLIRRLVDSIDIVDAEAVVDIGAGTGALAIACAERGAHVIAIERDAAWARRLADNVAAAGVAERVDVVRADARSWPLPTSPYRVVADPPFGMSTDVLSRLLDDPERGPTRCDLVLQREVVVKRAQVPPDTLRSATWAPWWTFDIGLEVPRTAFRPVPQVDAAVLTIRRRDDPVLPPWLATRFADALRPAWGDGRPRSGQEPTGGVRTRRRRDGGAGGTPP